MMLGVFFGVLTISEIAEGLAVAYGQLMERDDERLSVALDRLFEAVAEMDRSGGGLESHAVRSMLDLGRPS
ncbi:hypothetical protein BH11GEM2_BH11GEM2_37640 [soil metagenome]